MTTTLIVERGAAAGPSPERGSDHPGRWIGGGIGALACLPSLAIGLALNGWAFSKPSGFVAIGASIATFSALGIPIGWLLGRQLWPSLRSGGRSHALAIGLAFGWIAPILGAIEICCGGLLVPWAGSAVLLGADGLWFLPIAIPVSFLAAPLTLSVGVFWALLGRVVPSAWATAARMPRPVDRLGTRHILIAILAWIMVAEIATVALRSPRPWG